MSKERGITPAEENGLRSQFDEALRHIVLDRAGERRVEVAGCYEARGFTAPIPKPCASNHEFERRRKAGQELHFRHATKIINYEAFMAANGQAEHWTLTHEDRKKVVWEPTEEGYWFWAEVPQDCPRLGTTWNDFTINMLSLEEYAIVWWTTKSLTGLKLDSQICCWLRTRYKTEDGLGSLDAFVYHGVLGFEARHPDDLSVPGRYRGGRSSEVVKRVA